MSYQSFAAYYDQLMSEAPYDKWIDYVQQQFYRHNQTLKGLTVLDIGCGTGEVILRLHNRGAAVAGVDLSGEMLTIARDKCEQSSFTPILLQQSMAELDVVGTYQLVTILCDSLNYLKSEEEVKQTFQRIFDCLEYGGVLIFDVHSLFKVEQGYIGQTFADDREDISYIWTSFEGEHPASVEHELTFFVLEEDGKYRRFEEVHNQRTFSIDDYRKWLTDAGFVIDSITADFEEKPPTAESERIFFCARKK
ncbi:class I SAM-dependent DNA methyltransferase [Bacillus suaedae]|uniref:Methyltransferase domain-containing protein n=1 Tax=Halalkalibacter suaedae TaxID=2822140 RepID=A0A940WVE9_9BACI|nr:class I SAM-dependent methyltransferase [Bacillus suaedae]MBP3951332.1 methyltransferase domain-containing protein [Bacillus suaedae]